MTMKNIIYLILFITEIFFAQNSFEKGNALYQKGEYEQAIIQYESVLANQQHSSELYFNLGNCYYKLNMVAPSIYNYEKALLLNADDFEITNNLEFAQKLQIDEIKVLPKVGFSKLILDNINRARLSVETQLKVGAKLEAIAIGQKDRDELIAWITEDVSKVADEMVKLEMQSLIPEIAANLSTDTVLRFTDYRRRRSDSTS